MFLVSWDLSQLQMWRSSARFLGNIHIWTAAMAAFWVFSWARVGGCMASWRLCLLFAPHAPSLTVLTNCERAVSMLQLGQLRPNDGGLPNPEPVVYPDSTPEVGGGSHAILSQWG